MNLVKFSAIVLVATTAAVSFAGLAEARKIKNCIYSVQVPGKGEGRSFNKAFSNAKSLWRQNVRNVYGSAYTNLGEAIAKKRSCKKTETGKSAGHWRCNISAIPCLREPATTRELPVKKLKRPVRRKL